MTAFVPWSATPSGFGSLKARTEALAEAWELAALGPVWCPQNCACGAGMGLPPVSASDTVIDLVEFLAVRATAENDAAISEALAPMLAGPKPALADWLRALPAADLPSGGVERLLSRIEVFIDSLRPARAGSRFVCT